MKHRLFCTAACVMTLLSACTPVKSTSSHHTSSPGGATSTTMGEALLPSLLACDGSFFAYAAKHDHELAVAAPLESSVPGYARYVPGKKGITRFQKVLTMDGIAATGFLFDLANDRSSIYWGFYIAGTPQQVARTIRPSLDAQQGPVVPAPGSGGFARVEWLIDGRWTPIASAVSQGVNNADLRHEERVLEISEDVLPDGSKGTLLACSLQHNRAPLADQLLKGIVP